MENENKWEYDYSSANNSQNTAGETGYPNVGSSGMNTANTAATYGEADTTNPEYTAPRQDSGNGGVTPPPAGPEQNAAAPGQPQKQKKDHSKLAKSAVALVLAGALIAVFPTVTSTFAYEYVADGYCLAMLAACLSALLLTRPGRRSFFAGAACLWFSVGIYQAYLTVTITLLLVWLLDDLLFHRRSAAASLRSAGRFLAGGVLAGAVYAVALQLVLAFSGTALSDYQGFDTVGSLHLWSALHGCITRFFRFFFGHAATSKAADICLYCIRENILSGRRTNQHSVL